MSDKSKLEVVDTIDRRRNKRYHPTNLEIKVTGTGGSEAFIVDDISLEGVRLFAKEEQWLCLDDKVILNIPGLDCKIQAKVHRIDKDSIRIVFPKEQGLQQLLEDSFTTSKIFA